MPRLTRFTTLAVVISTLTLSACGTWSQQPEGITLKSYVSQISWPLTGAAEVPPVDTSAKGAIEVNLEPGTRLLSWTIRYEGTSGPVTAAHFHGPALPGANADVVVPITGNLTSPIQGSKILSPEEAADFTAGQWYINLHTAQHPSGELRAQIPAQP